MAGVRYAQGQYGEALKLYKQSLAILLKVHGPDHPEVATLKESIRLTVIRIGIEPVPKK
jgi:hypothetical protein